VLILTNLVAFPISYVYFVLKFFKIIIIQYRPVIRRPDIRKSGYKKGSGRVLADLLFVIT
jgi:hypothetical protein